MLIAVKGEKNSGKTRFIEDLLKRLNEYNVVVIKSSEHEYADIEGKDTCRYRKAGANISIISAKKEMGLFTDKRELQDVINIARKFLPDLIIIEGYKSVEKLNCRVIDVEKDDIDSIHEEILQKLEKNKIEIFVDGRAVHLNEFVRKMYHKTIKAMVSSLKNGEGKEIEILIKDF